MAKSLVIKLFAVAAMIIIILSPMQLYTSPGDDVKDEYKHPEGYELPLKPERWVEFETDEATWMSVDVSPNGKEILIDILGDLYVVPFSGGEAKNIMPGMAWETQAKYSPNGKQIVFISDRGGNDNIWVANADGSEPRAITKDKDYNFGSPSWLPDGDYIIARKYGEYPFNSYLRKSLLWMYHKDGGKGIEVSIEDDETHNSGASFSPDGRYAYFSSHKGGFQYNVATGRFQVRRVDLQTGERQTITSVYGGAIRPVISPDGKWMAYATRYDFHTGLMLQNLETREEHWLAYPTQRDDQEGFAVNDVLPGYSFTHDGKYVVISYGGKIHKISVDGKSDTVIPFNAKVKQGLGPLVYFMDEINEADISVRQIRWPSLSPKGDKIVFSAVGKLYSMETKNGRIKRLTKDDRLEYMPLFSPNGKDIVYVSWSDKAGGQIMKVSAKGGKSKQLTKRDGFYSNPSFSRDGSKILFIAGSSKAWLAKEFSEVRDLKWMSSKGGTQHRIIRSPGISTRAFFNKDASRVYFIEGLPSKKPGEEGSTAFKSVRIDGIDEKTHLIFKGPTEIVPSPDEKWIFFTSYNNAFLSAFPKLGKKEIKMSTSSSPVPLKQITKEGAFYINWSKSGNEITWGFADKFFSLSLDSVRAKFIEKPDEDEDEDEEGKDSDSTDTKKDDEDEEEEEDEPEFNPKSYDIKLTVKRAVPSSKVALLNARIITMKGDEIIEMGDILVEGNRITAIGNSGTLSIPAVAEKFDLSGKTIIPGFVDIHAHLGPQPDIIPNRVASYAANLAYGVTTTRDPSNSNKQVFAASEMVEHGDIIGPRIYSTGNVMYPGLVKIPDRKAAKHHVRRYKELGADFLKQYMQPRRIQRQWIIMEAMKAGLNVTAEGGGDLKMDLSMVLDGYTGFEHSLPVVPLYKDVVELIARAKTYYTPTMIVSYGGMFGQFYWRGKYDIHSDDKLRNFTPHGEIDRNGRRRTLLLDDDYHFKSIAKGVKDIVEAGGYVGLGAHGEQQGIGAHWELWMMASGGMSNHDVLRSATLTGAYTGGLQDDIGSLEVGKVADLLVLNSNPLDDIKNSIDILYVMKNGDLFNADNLNKITGDKARFEPFFWVKEDAQVNSMLNSN